MTANRSAEAARLEADYLTRARAALRGHPDGIGILEGLREHIDAAVAEHHEPVGLARMAGILERLGPPEAVAPTPPAAPAVDRGPAPSPARDATLEAAYLDRLWLALLFGVIGIFIPVINVLVFEIVSLVLLALACRAAPPRVAPLRRAAPLAWGALIACVMIGLVSIVSLKAPLAALLLLPTWILCYILHLMLVWQVLGAAAILVTGFGQGHAQRLMHARVRYVIVFSTVAMLVLIGNAVIPGRRGLIENLVIDLLLLPVSWLIGWLFILRPMKPAREAMRSVFDRPGMSLDPRSI